MASGLNESEFNSLLDYVRKEKGRVAAAALKIAEKLARCTRQQVKIFKQEAKPWLSADHVERLIRHGLGIMSEHLAAPTKISITAQRFDQLHVTARRALNQEGKIFRVVTPHGIRQKTIESMTKTEAHLVFQPRRKPLTVEEQNALLKQKEKKKIRGSRVAKIEVQGQQVTITDTNGNKMVCPLNTFHEKLEKSGVLEFV